MCIWSPKVKSISLWFYFIFHQWLMMPPGFSNVSLELALFCVLICLCIHFPFNILKLHDSTSSRKNIPKSAHLGKRWDSDVFLNFPNCRVSSNKSCRLRYKAAGFLYVFVIWIKLVTLFWTGFLSSCFSKHTFRVANEESTKLYTGATCGYATIRSRLPQHYIQYYSSLV